MKIYTSLLTVLIFGVSLAQDYSSNYRSISVPVKDTIVIDSVSINSKHFEILDLKGAAIDSSNYQVNFKKGVVIISEKLQQELDSLTINYLRFPNFLTKTYYQFDPKIIVKNTGAIEKLYSLQSQTKQRGFTPFDGLNTVGSLSRGITIGNNQNAVVNSELDLQITGNLSEKVSIRASIQDANIPTQEGGYSQSLDEFDQIFIELYSDKWNIRAGDVELKNNKSYFGLFNKKVQGINLEGTIDHKNGAKSNAFVAGALVRGVFSKSQFTGQEGNQGPYKLVGPNGELYILVVSGSERVYVNGVLLNRGENEDYTIDYNAGEVKFNPTYPITANMRIIIEYQYTERNYTRFIGYGGGGYSDETMDINVYVYSENDAKNQPLQQNLSEEQVSILQEAGDDRGNMTAPSAIPDTYSENKILYRKETVNGTEIFVFSNDPEDDLYNVRFTFVGESMGNYIISETGAINRIYEYVLPIDGVLQGNYEPVVQLSPPTKLQVGGLNGRYRPSEKTELNFEIAVSNNDLNLFSEVDDGNNDGYATRFEVRQLLLTTTDSLKIKGYTSVNFINKDFRNMEGLYNVEFSRDWNLLSYSGNEAFITGGLELNHPKYGGGSYEFQKLDFSDNYKGSKHTINSNIRLGNLISRTNASYLKSAGDSLSSKFFRLHNISIQRFERSWVGAKLSIEDNQLRMARNDSLSPMSQKYNSYEAFIGYGDSTDVYFEAGYRFQRNDSVKNTLMQKVNTSNTYFVKSRLINSEDTQLSLYANYRVLRNVDEQVANDKAFNSQLLYNQNLLKGGININTSLATLNGVIPQQEFTYVKVEPGEGFYTWIDYNGNGIQDLEEFEIAQFPDEAEYIRILLPNRVFLKMTENKFSQILTLNPAVWKDNEGVKKFLSHFHNMTSYVVNRKVKRNNDAPTINPFNDGGDDQLGLVLNFRNTLTFNRGKQNYTTSYSFISTSSDQLLSFGIQKNKLKNHLLNFGHKFHVSWLASFKGSFGIIESESENFALRNYRLETHSIAPKISYLLNRRTRFNLSYEFLSKDNTIGELEQLNQQKIGFSFNYSNSQKISINGDLNFIENDFKGSAFSPVAYQMLEGLQPGTNFTWTLLLQKQITKYLDLNLSYFGRKSETTSTVHTGSVQLRAFF